MRFHVLIFGFAFLVNGTDGKNTENTFAVEINKFLKDPVFLYLLYSYQLSSS